MQEWVLSTINRYETDYKEYDKKHQHELAAINANLASYLSALNSTKSPLQVCGGYIHPEHKGLVAIDQKGGNKKVKLQQTRLYVYPQESTKTLFLLAIGNKISQRDDIKFCHDCIEMLKKGEANEPEI